MCSGGSLLILSNGQHIPEISLEQINNLLFVEALKSLASVDDPVECNVQS